MSPFAKEKLYRLYIRGATIKDLSLKFGCLPQRVKAIIYQKHLYWEEVYPRLGETHMRIAIEREAMYAADYPFIDYGTDLTLMAEMEKGVKIERLQGAEHDDAGNPDRKKMEEVEQYLSKMRPKTYDKVPEAFVGKGPNGYMLYDWVFHRTNRAPTVTDEFKNIVKWQGTEKEYLIKDKLLQRSKVGGLRFCLQVTRRK